MESYLYAKTETFEAVVLPANSSYMLIVLPAPGNTIKDLEHQLAGEPDSFDKALQKHLGTVAMPLFHFQCDSNLRPRMEEMGIKTVFNDLGRIIDIPSSHLTEIKQNVDIQVDKNGILASADTVMGAIYGGIMGAQDMFHMSLDRPFLFLIRDQNTNALLFIGAVMDPTQN